MVLERRCPLLLVGPVARGHFIAADDAVFDLIDAHQTLPSASVSDLIDILDYVTNRNHNL